MKIKYSLVFTLLLIVFCFNLRAFAQLPVVYFNGITLDDVRDLNTDQWNALKALPSKTIVRVVFNADTKPDEYKKALDDLHLLTLPDGKTQKIYIMGELLDSDFLARYLWGM